MINLDEINAEIAKLEDSPLSYSTVERLAWLFIVRDHITSAPAVSVAGEIPKGDSEFMRACSGKSVCQVMGIADELMEALMVMQPRLYNAVMDKLA